MSTMREESWPEPDVIVTGQGYHEHAYSVRLVRQIAEAAYAAGQRAERDECAKVCIRRAQLLGEAVAATPDGDWMRRVDGFFNGAIQEAEECALAIRARDKEQGC